jgi:hypothetical protein
MLISGIKKKTVKPFTILHGTQVVAYEKVPSVGGKFMDAVRALAEGKLGMVAGPAVWSYRAAGPGKLALRAGQIVRPGTRGKAPLAARQEPAWRCVSGIYRGPMDRIIAAWDELFDAVTAKGIPVSDERREIYRKWVAHDSKDNVTELQLRLKG